MKIYISYLVKKINLKYLYIIYLINRCSDFHSAPPSIYGVRLHAYQQMERPSFYTEFNVT